LSRANCTSTDLSRQILIALLLAGAGFGVVVTLSLSRTAWFRDALEAPDRASRHFENRPHA